MKTMLALFLSGTCTFCVYAQHDDCGTREPAAPLLIDPALLQKTNKQLSGPITVKLFIHLVTFEAPSNVLYPDEEKNVMDNLEAARDFWAPQGICFILQGIDTVQSDDLALMNTESQDDITELETYLVPGALNVFIHPAFVQDGLLGTAYNIPNNYISLLRDYTWGGFRMLMAHEIGHCFGLYHTFSTAYGQERVTRAGGCKNCTTVGDLLCDTEADVKDVPAYNVQNCGYLGALKDSCNTTYRMALRNLMSYHYSETCLDQFTAGQGERARYFLANNSLVTPMVLTADSYVRSANATVSTGARIFYTYRNSISIEAVNYTVQQGGQLQMASKEIVLKPGTDFVPGSAGFVMARGNKCE